jgi:hypothetical protein
MTILEKLMFKGSSNLSKDFEDAAQSLKESAKQMASSLKQTYNTKIRPALTGGVEGAGLTGASFFNQLGLTGLASSYKEKREQEEKERMGIYGPSASSEENEAASTDTEKAIKNEKEDEANTIRQEQLEIQKKTSDDIMALYTITDDYQKKMLEKTKEMAESLKTIAEKPAGSGEGEGGGSLLDIDLPGKGSKAGKAGKLGTAGRLASGAKGFMAGGGTTLAAGASMVAAPFAIDAVAGAFGYGGKEIDEEQDDKNWERASLFEKIQSAPARGLEKIGSLFGGNLANEARAERIKNETAYLDAKGGVSNEAKNIKEQNASQQIEFSEATFAQKDPENYAKFKEFENKKVEELKAKDPFNKDLNLRNQQMVRKTAEIGARKEAIVKFKKEIEAAGAGSVQGQALQKNDQTVSQQQQQKTGDAVAKNNTEQKETKASASAPTPLPAQTASLPTTQATPLVTAPKSDSGIGNKTVEQLAMDEAKKFGRTQPNLDDKRAAAMLYRKQAAGSASEADLSGVSTLPVDKAGAVADKTASLKDQEAAAQNKQETAAPTIVNNTSIANNQSGEKQKVKDTKNNETTFQKYIDRRYYPA